MATPIGHALAGYGISRMFKVRRLDLTILTVGMALAPDLDFIPGLLVGQPALYHSEITHSFFLGSCVSLFAAGVYATLRKVSFIYVFALFFTAYCSHLLLDYVNADGRPPYGIPLFWPLSSEHYISPIILLPGVQHAGTANASTAEFVMGILSPRNILAVVLEIVIILPLIYLGQRGQRYIQSLKGSS